MTMMPRKLLLFVLIISFLVTFVQLQVFQIAFSRLGLSPGGGLLLVVCALLGSPINIPVGSVDSSYDPAAVRNPPGGQLLPFRPLTGIPGKTIIAVNIGGCAIPVGLCLYQLLVHLVSLMTLLPALAVVALVSRLASRPIPGVGIGMPVLLAPLVAALMALMLAPANPAPLAFCSGVLGVLLGADILRLRDIRRMGVPFAAIGGAGTFDGVFLAGIVAALLA
jgi:uncharacterized membrane protein